MAGPRLDPADFGADLRSLGQAPTAGPTLDLASFSEDLKGLGSPEQTGLGGTAARLFGSAVTPRLFRPATGRIVSQPTAEDVQPSLAGREGFGDPEMQAFLKAPQPEHESDEQGAERILANASPEALAHPNILGAASAGGAATKELGYMAATRAPSEALAVGTEEALGGRLAGAAEEAIPGRAGTVIGRGATSAVSGAAAAAPYAVGRETLEGTPASELAPKLPGYIAGGAAAGGLFGGIAGARANRLPTEQSVNAPGAATAADAFRALGLDWATATPADVQEAWVSRMKDFHPDVNPSPEAAQLAARYNAARDAALDALQRPQAAPTPRPGPPTAPPAAEPAAPPPSPEPTPPREPANAQQTQLDLGGNAPEPQPAPPAAPAPAEGQKLLTGEYLRPVEGAPQGIEVHGNRATPAEPEQKATLSEMTGADTWSRARDQIEQERAAQRVPASTTATPPPTPEATPKAAGPSHEDVLRMTPDEVDRAYEDQKAYEQGAAGDVFGDRAGEYERAYRGANSSDPDKAAAYQKTLDELESSLTPQQQQRLYGIGETGVNAEDLLPVRNVARQVRDIRTRTDEELVSGFARIMGGDRPGDLATKYLARTYVTEAARRGMPQQQLIESALSYNQGRNRLSPEDAATHLGDRLQKLGADQPPPPPEHTSEWGFQKTAEGKVGGKNGADRVDWGGKFNGRDVAFRTVPRSVGNLEGFGDEHYIDAEVHFADGDLSVPERAQLAKLIEQEDVDQRKALVRNKGDSVRSGVTSDGRVIAPKEKAPQAPRVPKVDYSVEGSNPKYKNLSTEALQDRLLELSDRIDAAQKPTAEGIRPWVRKDAGWVTGEGATNLSGTVVTGEAGRALGTIKTSGRLIDEVTKELEARGVPGNVVDHIEQAAERRGITSEAKPPADAEALAATQASGIPRELRQRLLETAGPHAATLDDRGLINAALESDRLSPQEQSDALDHLFGMGETGAVRGRPRVPGKPSVAPQKSIADAYRKLVYPERRGEDAKAAARLLRRAIGEQRRDIAVQYQALKGYRSLVPKLTTPEGIDWYDRAEGGRAQVSPKLQAANDEVRRLYAQLVKDVQDLGKGKLTDPIENYLSHIWADPAEAKRVMAQTATRKPLQGTKSFLKERSIPTLAEGLRQGLKAVTDNPIDLQLLKMREMRKYIGAQRFLADAREEGIAKYVPLGKGAPEGWRRVDDPTFTVYGRNDDGELILRGHYWMPEGAAHLVANYLSPGLRGNAIYDAYMGLGNTLNQLELGASGFHAGFSTFTSVISRVAAGIGQLRTARLGEALGSVVGAPVAPASMIAKGVGLKQAYLVPGTGSLLQQRLADLLARSGGQHVMDSAYKYNALQSLKDAAKAGNIPKALAHTLGLAIQGMAWPTMEFYVPTIKLGAFAELAQSELQRLGAGATDEQVDEAMQAVWHSIDNRFGQVSYDTRFWNNAVKHALMGAVRAVGWDAGTVDELVGGLKDALKGKPSVRLDFLLALPLTVALVNAVMQFAMTGEGPKDLQDAFEPRDGTFDAAGNPNRLTPATYMKDILGFARHPISTAEHKLHPVTAFLGDLLQNRDFYGDEIRNPNDPLSQQLAQVAKYVGTELTPISVRNLQEAKRRGESPGRSLLPFFGITPASREAVRTPAQNLLYDLLGERRPQGATPEEAAKREERAGALRSLRQGSGASPEALQDMTRRQRTGLFQQARTNPLVSAFKQLTLEEAEQVYAKANDHEKQLWGQILQGKRQRASRP